MKKISVLIALFLLPVISAETFPPQYNTTGYVGFIEEFEGPIDYRITYPAVSDGEGTNMAQNGPFAIVIFVGDEDETVDQYAWLQEGLTRNGFICLVLEEEVFEWEIATELLMKINNGTINSIPDSIGQFALSHVSLAGHGVGAHTAAEVYKTGLHEIDGLFGLGLDGSDSESQNQAILSNPASALFLTGTTDDIAPAADNVMIYLNEWPGAWQIMHVLGANHIGYQESDTFFERFADGESAMGKEQQQNHALKHILPYLNLSLRGDDSAYQEAFNREVKSYSSDPNSYIDENLSLSRLYNLSNTISTSNNLTLNQTFLIKSDVSMRNGDNASGNVTCLLPDSTEIAGTLQNFSDSQEISCEINSSDLPIGDSDVRITIHDNTFSDYADIMITRIGTPMELISPIPEVIFNQHGNITIYPGDFATDPDQKDVLFYAAEIADGTDIIGVNNSGFELTFTHQNQQEWDGLKIVNVTLTAGTDDYVTIPVNVTILPVNDMVLQTNVIPLQQTEEDGDSIILNIAEFVADPEGEPLFVEQAIEYEGLRITNSSSTVIIDPQSHWFGAEIVRLNVWDGESEKLEITVPINVIPVDDPIQFIKSTDSIEMDEDSILVVDLSDYSIDVDEESLSYEIVSNFSLVTYSLNGDILTIYGNDNAYGSESFSVNVADSSSNDSMVFDLMILPIPDIPIVQISSIDTTELGVSILWTVSDSDGSQGHVKTVTLAGESIGFDTECNGDTYITCLTEYRFQNQTAGFYTVEVKVWDGYAEVWSNVDFQNIEIVEKKVENDQVESSVFDSSILQIGTILLIVILLVVYTIQSKKN
ncbi:MAG: hypothetical protein ACPHDO_03760 [Candidatus Poseidoniaceae archaeon]